MAPQLLCCRDCVGAQSAQQLGCVSEKSRGRRPGCFQTHRPGCFQTHRPCSRTGMVFLGFPFFFARVVLLLVAFLRAAHLDSQAPFPPHGAPRCTVARPRCSVRLPDACWWSRRLGLCIPLSPRLSHQLGCGSGVRWILGLCKVAPSFRAQTPVTCQRGTCCRSPGSTTEAT